MDSSQRQPGKSGAAQGGPASYGDSAQPVPGKSTLSGQQAAGTEHADVATAANPAAAGVDGALLGVNERHLFTDAQHDYELHWLAAPVPGSKAFITNANPGISVMGVAATTKQGPPYEGLGQKGFINIDETYKANKPVGYGFTSFSPASAPQDSFPASSFQYNQRGGQLSPLAAWSVLSGTQWNIAVSYKTLVLPRGTISSLHASSGLLDIAHILCDAASLIPDIGWVFALGNAVLDIAEGNYSALPLDLATAIPGAAVVWAGQHLTTLKVFNDELGSALTAGAIDRTDNVLAVRDAAQRLVTAGEAAATGKNQKPNNVPASELYMGYPERPIAYPDRAGYPGGPPLGVGGRLLITTDPDRDYEIHWRATMSPASYAACMTSQVQADTVDINPLRPQSTYGDPQFYPPLGSFNIVQAFQQGTILAAGFSVSQAAINREPLSNFTYQDGALVEYGWNLNGTFGGTKGTSQAGVALPYSVNVTVNGTILPKGAIK